MGDAAPQPLGSYAPEDVTFLLTDITGKVPEQSTEERERAIQRGVHYSEMLPREYRPTERYMQLFEASLRTEAANVAFLAGVTAERIRRVRGDDVVLLSLARSGTPAGIVIRRYLKHRYGLRLPHFSISIIRGKGIDANALRYVVERYGGERVLFVDGWTGKGAIARELDAAVAAFNRTLEAAPAGPGGRTGPSGSGSGCSAAIARAGAPADAPSPRASGRAAPVDSMLAVLADPGGCAAIRGTGADCLIPSACLNATVSGLVSRTFHRTDVIGRDDFHGVRFYRELAGKDVSRRFVDTVAAELDGQLGAIDAAVFEGPAREEPDFGGAADAQRLAEHFAISDVNLVKPGVGETTRVLLRRVPWKILVNPERGSGLEHVYRLAEERGVPVEPWPDMRYACCGLIRALADT